MAKTKKDKNGSHDPSRANGGQTLARMPGNPLTVFRDEMDSLFNRFLGHWPVAFERGWGMDVDEADHEIVVRAEAPGFDPKDFEIHVSGNTLMIEAEHTEKAEDKTEGSSWWEQRYGRFQRAIPLSTAVNTEKVDARYRNGILEVHLPRTEPSPKHRIEVKA